MTVGGGDHFLVAKKGSLVLAAECCRAGNLLCDAAVPGDGRGETEFHRMEGAAAR